MLLLRTLNVFLRVPTLAVLHYSLEVKNYLLYPVKEISLKTTLFFFSCEYQLILFPPKTYYL